MPLSKEKKAETRDRLNRDPEFRDSFLTEARNMYRKALEFDPSIESLINQFEQVLGSDPDTFEFDKDEPDELDMFEIILDAYDKQMLLDEKSSGTIN